MYLCTRLVNYVLSQAFLLNSGISNTGATVLKRFTTWNYQQNGQHLHTDLQMTILQMTICVGGAGGGGEFGQILGKIRVKVEEKLGKSTELCSSVARS